MIKRLTDFNSSTAKKITYNNGKEFSKYYEIAELFIAKKQYFTGHYTSQVKGTVENGIGMVRRFFPKRTVSNNLVKQVKNNEITLQLEKLITITQ